MQIDAAGNVRVEVRGVAGAACEDLTWVLEQALGGQIVERVRKPEYDQVPAQAKARSTQRN